VSARALGLGNYNVRGNTSNTNSHEINKKNQGRRDIHRHEGTKITLPVDNELAMRKFQTIELKEDTELMNEANLDLWIAIREERKYWRKKFHVVTTNSHEVDAACKKGTDFAHEKAATNRKLVRR
jgi:hypothetical protein